MARGFQSHHDEEPQRLTTAAARSTEESARLRDDLAGATDEFAFEVPAAMSVGTNSILASSGHSSGEDAVHATLAANAERPLRTSTFTKLAGTVLDRASLASSQSSDGYGSARSGQFNDSLIRSPEFDKMSLDATPVTQTAAIAAAADENNHSRDSETVPVVAPSVPAPSALPVRPAFDDSFLSHRPTGARMTIMEMSTGPTSSEVEFRGTERQRRNTTNYYPSAPVQLQARFTSGMAANDASMHSSGGMSRELEQNAFTASMSESTYLNMRKTLDPEALLNGDPTNSANMAVLSSLRPVTDPFDLTRDPNLPGPDFQRGRAATTGTAMVSGRMTVGRTTGVARGSSRLQRSYTVAGSMAGGVPAPAILAHDPRGTFRTTTADTAQQIFASQQVRLQNKWGTDVWIYMKNSHPFLGLCTAHRWHPYKKKDRALVLLTTLLLALLLTGLYATQQCCQSAAESAVAVIAKNNSSNTKQPHRRLAQSVVNCRPFGATCDATANLCSLGASCVEGKCVPLEAKAATMQCSATAATSQCPAGWRCASQGVCRPSTSLVCYLSAEATAATRVKAMALDAETREAGSHSGSGPDAPLDALSAIAALLKYGKDNNLPTDGSTVPPPATTPVPPPATVRPSVTQTPTPTSATPVATTPTPTTASVAPTPTPTPTTAKPPLLNSTVNNNRDEAVLDPAMINATVETLLLTLKQPLDQGVYTVASKIPIVWEVKVLQGERSFVDTLRFRVDFSKDGGKNFTMIASDIASDSVLNVSPIKYHFTWDLAHDDALACSNCVLRVCTQPDATTPSDPFCIRTDGATAMTSTATATASGALTAATSTATTATPRITFHIVRDIVECACGIKHAAFVTYSYLLALAVPVALLVLEQLVTFYQDSKVLGMFARRGGPKMPMIGFYASEATARGRLVLVFLSVGLVFACGMVAARISKDNFPESTRDVLVLWVLMFALVVVVGFIYCSIIYCVAFTVRWYQDEKTWNQQGFADFAMMFDDSRNNQTMLQSQQSHGFAPPDPATAGSYQWPFAGDASGSVHSSYSQAVVTQRSGQAIV